MENDDIIQYGLIERITASIYISSVSMLFIVVLCYMCYKFVIPTWKQKDEADKQKWKTFWNHIEIIWLCSVFGAMLLSLPAAWNQISQYEIDSFTYDIDKNLRFIRSESTGIDRNLCANKTRLPERLCSIAKDLLIEKEFSSTELFTISTNIFDSVKKMDRTDEFYTSILNLADIVRQTGQYTKHKETNQQFRPGYVRLSALFSIFWPFVLAFALGLRISKAIAAYKL